MVFSKVEGLESRSLLSADVSVQLVSSTLPTATLVAGEKVSPTAKASYKLSLNGGTLTKQEAKTKLTLTVVLRKQGSADIVLGTASIPASAMAKKDFTANLAFSKLKVAPTGGSYSMVATLTGQAGVGDTNANNDSVATAVTVTQPTSPFGNTFGNKITFKITQTQRAPAAAGFRAQTMQSGTWSDNAGHSGTFFYTSGGNDSANGAMSLAITAGGGVGGSLKWSSLVTGRDAPILASTTYVFGSATAKVATVVFAGQTINVNKA